MAVGDSGRAPAPEANSADTLASGLRLQNRGEMKVGCPRLWDLLTAAPAGREVHAGKELTGNGCPKMQSRRGCCSGQGFCFWDEEKCSTNARTLRIKK